VLTRNGRPIRKTLKALTDPVPEFVSLVFGGANKTPFRAMRADGTAISETVVSEETAIKSETHGIAKVEFNSAQFADEAAVTAWLVAGGYDPDLKVSKTESGFIVDATADLPADAIVSLVDLSDTTGVKIHAVALKTDDSTLELTQRAETDADVHPGATPEMRQRYCGCVETCNSCYGEGDTLAEVVANNWEGVPPGLLDLTMSLYDAVRNCLKDGNYQGAVAAVGEYLTMLDALTKLFPAAEEKTFKAFIDAIAPEIEMSKEQTEATEVAKTEDAVEAGAVDATVETAEKTDETTEESGGVVEGEATEMTAEKAETGETGEQAVGAVETAEKTEENSDTAADADVSDPLTRLTAVVSELAATITTMKEDLHGKVETVVQRVAAIEDVRQTRKGADVDETNTASTTASVSDDIASLRTRSVLGMRRSDSR
jgi:hypothetical protein